MGTYMDTHTQRELRLEVSLCYMSKTLPLNLTEQTKKTFLR